MVVELPVSGFWSKVTEQVGTLQELAPLVMTTEPAWPGEAHAVPRSSPPVPPLPTTTATAVPGDKAFGE